MDKHVFGIPSPRTRKPEGFSLSSFVFGPRCGRVRFCHHSRERSQEEIASMTPSPLRRQEQGVRGRDRPFFFWVDEGEFDNGTRFETRPPFHPPSATSNHRRIRRRHARDVVFFFWRRGAPGLLSVFLAGRKRREARFTLTLTSPFASLVGTNHTAGVFFMAPIGARKRGFFALFLFFL